nr:alpha/beta fold hydrolase [Ktedonobacterales bacterium]
WSSQTRVAHLLPFVRQTLAARRPELLRSLILLETSADPEPAAHVPRYRQMARVARLFGTRLVSARVMPIMFGETFMSNPARAAERAEWRRMEANSRAGAARATIGVVERQGVADELARIALPTLIVVGDQDVATPPEKARRMHERIAGSRLVVTPNAGHTATVEEPVAVNAAITTFLAAL